MSVWIYRQNYISAGFWDSKKNWCLEEPQVSAQFQNTFQYKLKISFIIFSNKVLSNGTHFCVTFFEYSAKECHLFEITLQPAHLIKVPNFAMLWSEFMKFILYFMIKYIKI